MSKSDRAGENMTRRSRTGFFISCYMALVNCLSKKQSTTESAVLRAEFVAMKHIVETFRGLRYKLMIMGVPIEVPRYIYGDNMFVIYNTSRPESVFL